VNAVLASGKLGEMRRGIQIAIALSVILVLVEPFDCFASLTSSKAADCGANGRRLVTRTGDVSRDGRSTTVA
jgi:hypothetical protein